MVRRVEVPLAPGAVGVPMARAVQEVVDDPSRPLEEVVISPAIERPAVLPSDNFFDPAEPAAEARVVLERTFQGEREVFRLTRPIGYWDAEVGAVIVPDNLGRFDTDLTSVMRFFTWLVATTGVHLPAALVHDGLVAGRTAGPSYVASRQIDRVTADGIFRRAMRDLGTSWVQRWLIWAAVATATMVSGPVRRAWGAWLAVAATALVVVVGGTLSTVDLFDCRAVVPWMGGRPAWLEVLTGALGAFVIPLLTSLLWGRMWRAGAIAGVALALLLHVTLALVVVYAVFATAEAVGEAQVSRALRWAGVAAGTAAAVVLVGMWAC